MKKETWKELTIGTINLDAGNSVKNLTGTWRSGRKPQFVEEKCIQCFFCWLYCPHFAILVEDGEVKVLEASGRFQDVEPESTAKVERVKLSE